MKKFLGAGLLILVAAGGAAAQDTKLYSTPSLPSREVLDRLNLRLAWTATVPMDGRRDGFLSVQVAGNQIIAQTRSGLIAAYDAETGRQQWRVPVGKAYDPTFTPTWNSKSVLVINGVTLFALDRGSGAIQWQNHLPFGISAAPVVDQDERVAQQPYLSGVSGRSSAYRLPTVTKSPGENDAKSQAPDPNYPGGREALLLNEVRPDPIWDYSSNQRLDYAPLMTRDVLFYASPTGNVLALGKYPLTEQSSELYRFKLDRSLSVAPSVYEEIAYLATTDTNLTAVNMTTGKTLWRFTAGAAITRTPFLTDRDVYLTVERKGLVRLDRDTATPKWKLPYGKTMTNSVVEAERMIAVNKKFIYAADRVGRLLVLDRDTGKQLSYYEPFRDYVFPVSNTTTDRLYLAANNGQIICLHDREYEKPLQHGKLDTTVRAGTDRIKALQDKLARKVTEKGGDAVPLVEVLDSFKRRYSIDIFVSDRAFRDAGLPPILDKPVNPPRVEEQELGDVLKNLLAQVGAVYEVTGDIIQVLPPKKVVMGMGDPMVNPMPMPPPQPVDNVLRQTLAKKMNPPTAPTVPLSDMLQFYADRFEVKIDSDEKSLKMAGINFDEVLKKDVTHPNVQGLPFGQALRDVLGQVKCDYEVRGDKIFVVPVKK